jgi:hypothetical protein
MILEGDKIKPKARHGHAPAVYVMGNHEDGPVKIGTSSDISRRVLSLQTGNALPILVFSMRLVVPKHLPAGENFGGIRTLKQEAVRLEKAAHFELIKMGLRLMGEWFDLSSDEARQVIDKVSANIGSRALARDWLATHEARLDPEYGWMRDDLLSKATNAEAQAAKVNQMGLTSFEKAANL